MDKKYLSPLELIKIATQHAYCAEYLLNDNAEIVMTGHGVSDALDPFVSLMYVAFELTLKAYLLHDYKKNYQHKKLIDMLDLTSELGFSKEDRQLLKHLSWQHAFRKGVDYELWENRQQFHVFCAEIIKLYERLQKLMPLELQSDYQ
jgi:hypothetical protein